MVSIGEHLKQIRQAKGLSIEDLSKISKINPRFIKSLESEEFGPLPGGVFNRGFIKSYAHCCGVNEKELLAEYEEVLRAQKGPELNLMPIEPAAGSSWPVHRAFIYVIAGVVIIVLIAVGMFFYSQSRGPASDANITSESMTARQTSSTNPAADNQASSGSQSPATPGVLPPPTSGEDSNQAATTTAAGPGSTSPSNPAALSRKPTSASPDRAENKEPLPGSLAGRSSDKSNGVAKQVNPTGSDSGGAFSLRIVASENTWLSIRRDGKEVYRKVMLPRESVSLTARDKFDIVCGNAAGVSVTLDGNVQPPLGKEGEVKFVTFRRPASAAPPQP